ncbi:MAG: site-2 protease family protein [Oscillospiraceae bacterium]|nr:site-2 protease family protein [Oscillospiraceae bacterium]
MGWSALKAFMGGDIQTGVIILMSGVFVLFVSLSFHECAHAFIANKLGDPTALYSGRITMNPFKHLDPFGSLLILTVGFGWAKPVPVNTRNFRHPRRDMALTALAGPASNLILAFVSLLILYIIWAVSGIPNSDFLQNLNTFIGAFVGINISLAIFNLVPIPPLDGSRILTYFLPDRAIDTLQRLEPFFPFILMFIMISGTLSTPIWVVSGWVYDGFSALLGLIFRPFF